LPDPNSMLVWWPKIKDLGIPVPKTEIIPIDRDRILEAMDGPQVIHPEVLAPVQEAADRMGYPVFVRTDLASGKHDWKRTCFVPNSSSLSEHVLNVCEANELWTLIGLDYQAIAVREFLNLDSSFTAFSGNMPINKEFRFFVRDGKYVCHHFYWPEEVFNQHEARMAHDPEWRKKLEIMNYLSYQELLLLVVNAEMVGAALPGFWSVDFAAGTDGKWYLIDMALGKNSYHWPGCPNGG
jgi:ATP-grasp domain, R2K clade family 3